MGNELRIVNRLRGSGATPGLPLPPYAPLDFDSLVKICTRLAPQSAPPSPATRGDVYLDDGTNTRSGKPGLRWFDGTQWLDLGGDGNGTGGAARLDDLLDVEAPDPDDGAFLAYDAAAQVWKPQLRIDGGEF